MSFFLAISSQQEPSALENSATILMFISSFTTHLINTDSQNTETSIFQHKYESMQQYLII